VSEIELPKNVLIRLYSSHTAIESQGFFLELLAVTH
jgi:hypothetical protein